MKRKNTKSESQESWVRQSCKPPNNSSSSRGSGKRSSGPTRRSHPGRCRRWWRGSRRSTLPKVERRFEAGSVLGLRGWRCRPGWWRSWGRARRGWSRTSGCGRQDRRARARRKGKRRGKREWLRLEEFLSTFSVLSLGLKLIIILYCTVKPVNYDHPWDPKKLVVVAKVVGIQRSSYKISNLFWPGFRMVVVYRW